MSHAGYWYSCRNIYGTRFKHTHKKNFFGTYDKLHIIVPLIVIKMIIMLGSNGCIQYLNWDKLVSRRLYSLCVFLWLCVSHSPRFFLFLSRSRTGACVVRMSCVWYSLIPTVKKGALSLYVSLYCWNRTHCHPGGRSKNSNGKWQFSSAQYEVKHRAEKSYVRTKTDITLISAFVANRITIQHSTKQ